MCVQTFELYSMLLYCKYCIAFTKRFFLFFFIFFFYHNHGCRKIKLGGILSQLFIVCQVQLESSMQSPFISTNERNKACIILYGSLWDFIITSSRLTSPAVYTPVILMAWDLWRFNFMGERFSNSPRESFTSIWYSDTYICSLHCPQLHQGYSLGEGKKTNWWQICPGVVIVKPYSMM